MNDCENEDIELTRKIQAIINQACALGATGEDTGINKLVIDNQIRSLLSRQREDMENDALRKYKTWVDCHPDVWEENEFKTPHHWWVLNLLGDMFGNEFANKVWEYSQLARIRKG